jgi:hypothetical protein
MSLLTFILAELALTELWPKVDDNKPLTLFHWKYWDKSIEAEEAEWHNAQSKNEHKQQYWQGQDLYIEDEESEDLVPGCYFLDMDIKGLPVLSLWIRVNYIHIYEVLHCEYPMPMEYMGRTCVMKEPWCIEPCGGTNQWGFTHSTYAIYTERRWP